MVAKANNGCDHPRFMEEVRKAQKRLDLSQNLLAQKAQVRLSQNSPARKAKIHSSDLTYAFRGERPLSDEKRRCVVDAIEHDAQDKKVDIADLQLRELAKLPLLESTPLLESSGTSELRIETAQDEPEQTTAGDIGRRADEAERAGDWAQAAYLSKLAAEIAKGEEDWPSYLQHLVTAAASTAALGLFDEAKKLLQPVHAYKAPLGAERLRRGREFQAVADVLEGIWHHDCGDYDRAGLWLDQGPSRLEGNTTGDDRVKLPFYQVFSGGVVETTVEGVPLLLKYVADIYQGRTHTERSLRAEVREHAIPLADTGLAFLNEAQRVADQLGLPSRIDVLRLVLALMVARPDEALDALDQARSQLSGVIKATSKFKLVEAQYYEVENPNLATSSIAEAYEASFQGGILIPMAAKADKRAAILEISRKTPDQRSVSKALHHALRSVMFNHHDTEALTVLAWIYEIAERPLGTGARNRLWRDLRAELLPGLEGIGPFADLRHLATMLDKREALHQLGEATKRADQAIEEAA